MGAKKKRTTSGPSGDAKRRKTQQSRISELECQLSGKDSRIAELEEKLRRYEVAEEAKKSRRKHFPWLLPSSASGQKEPQPSRNGVSLDNPDIHTHIASFLKDDDLFRLREVNSTFYKAYYHQHVDKDAEFNVARAIRLIMMSRGLDPKKLRRFPNVTHLALTSTEVSYLHGTYDDDEGLQTTQLRLEAIFDLDSLAGVARFPKLHTVENRSIERAFHACGLINLLHPLIHHAKRLTGFEGFGGCRTSGVELNTWFIHLFKEKDFAACQKLTVLCDWLGIFWEDKTYDPPLSHGKLRRIEFRTRFHSTLRGESLKGIGKAKFQNLRTVCLVDATVDEEDCADSSIELRNLSGSSWWQS